MKMNLPFITFFLVLVISCSGRPAPDAGAPEKNRIIQSSVKRERLDLFDKVRNRAVPVMLYYSEEHNARAVKQKVAIFSHGYGGTNTAYSFIAENLVSLGYFVISVQHELPSDEPLPLTGKPYEVRMPNWQRGVQNMLFAIGEISRMKPHLDFKNLLVAGHSNGGDMAVLFAHRYPGQVENVISLDNRRMPLPRTRKPRVLSLRSRDQPADEGVLPTPEEQQQFGIRIIRLDDTAHNDMYDGATEKQKEEINGVISAFLK
jgi:dienelactone hydrolase